MRIAIVIEKYDATGGGNERSTHQIAQQLASRGHHVTILCESAAETSAGSKPVSIEPASTGSTRSATGLKRFAAWAESRIAKGGFDVSLSMITAVVADVMQPRGGTVAETQLRNVALRRNAVSRAFKQTSLKLNPKQRAMLALEQRAMRDSRIKKWVAISGYVAEQFSNHYSVSGDRVAHIPNAAEVTHYTEEERQRIRNEERARLQIPDDRTVFLYAAMNHRLKGFHELLLTIMSIEGFYDRCDTIFVGPGLDHKPYNPNIKYFYFGNMGVWRPSVAVLKRGPSRMPMHFPGEVENIDRLLLAADVLVHPTWYDPSSKVVLEALLMGRPAITTLHNGAAQYIFDPSARHPVPSAFDNLQPCVIDSPVQQGGCVVSSLDDVPSAYRIATGKAAKQTIALAQAMQQMCDPDHRAKCMQAIKSANLPEKISMKAHVDALEQVLISASN